MILINTGKIMVVTRVFKSWSGVVFSGMQYLLLDGAIVTVR